MSQVIGFPAASQEFAQKALSPLSSMYFFCCDNSLSYSEAVTSILVFSTNRRAVSLTTAKASGSILLSTSSTAFWASSSCESICW